MTGTTQTSAAAAAKGTTVTATATCSDSGAVLLGGGGHVTTTAVIGTDPVYTQSSYPSSTTTWTVIGIVGATALPASQTMSVTAYALCSS